MSRYYIMGLPYNLRNNVRY